MKDIECRICNLNFKSLKSLGFHILKVHKDVKKYYDTYILNGIIATCKFCNGEVKFRRFTYGYSKYCSPRCSSLDPDTQKKVKETCLKKYGVEHAHQSKITRQKSKETCLKKYGVEHVSQVIEFKEKIKETFLKRYGVEHSSKLEITKEKKKKTCLEKYGVEHVSQVIEFKDKFKKTCLEKYGVDNPSHSKIVKQKTKENCLEKYGVDYITQVEEFKQKSKETCLKRYGVENPSQYQKVKEKKKETCLKRYGVEYSTQYQEVKEKKKKTLLEKFLPKMEKYLKELNIKLIDTEYQNAHYHHIWKCLKCNNNFETIWNLIQQGYLCPSCFPRNNGISNQEKEILEFVKSIVNDEILENSRKIIPPLEIDIYIPSKNIAIEFNGLYWHSEEVMGDNAKNYHLSKTEDCKKQGIQLIHIFEDEWIFKKDIVKSKLKNILNVSGSRLDVEKCDIEEIPLNIKNKFLEQNHIQGKDNSVVKLGSFFENNLVSIMTFSKGSKENDIWELNRFCNKLNYQISRMASKFLFHFKKNYEWKEIFSYVDRRWSNGNLYINLGFKLKCETESNYWNIRKYQRIYSEYIGEGYPKIWDCGNYQFELIRKDVI